MQELQKIIQKLRNLNLSDVVREVVDRESDTAIALNTEQLFQRGIDSEGESLGVYSPFTIAYKKAKGQRYDHITLYDEGDFYRGFFAKTSGWPGEVVFGSSDSKYDELADRYGDAIFGLTKDSINEFTEQIDGVVQERCTKAILSAFQ